MLFLIRSLGVGGAQRQLIEVARGLQRTGTAVLVATFYDGGWRQELLDAGVEVVSLGKRGRWDAGRLFLSLWRLVRRFRPNVIHGYMDFANLAASIGGRLSGARIVWGVRSSDVDFSDYDWFSRLGFKTSAWLSATADLIVFNSDAGREHHRAHGYSTKRAVTIANGFDTVRFRPDPAGRDRVRAAWGIRAGQPLIGLVGRLDPMKDHATFLGAAARVLAARPGTHFACIGDGPEPWKARMRQLGEDLHLSRHVTWSGYERDMPAVYNALDVSVCCSAYGEGFPNVVGEAMACGVPCVVTDVGDAARVVGPTGRVVPRRDSVSLARGCLDLLEALDRDRESVHRAVRERICEQFTIDILVGRTSDALLKLMSSRRLTDGTAVAETDHRP